MDDKGEARDGINNNKAASEILNCNATINAKGERDGRDNTWVYVMRTSTPASKQAPGCRPRRVRNDGTTNPPSIHPLLRISLLDVDTTSCEYRPQRLRMSHRGLVVGLRLRFAPSAPFASGLVQRASVAGESQPLRKCPDGAMS